MRLIQLVVMIAGSYFVLTGNLSNGGFVNAMPDFLDGPKVLNGASDLMVAAFGDKGRHARTTVGVAALP